MQHPQNFQNYALCNGKISWKCICPFFRYVVSRGKIPRKSREKSYIQGIKYNIPKMFQIDLCTMSDLSWKFDENTLTFVPARL